MKPKPLSTKQKIALGLGIPAAAFVGAGALGLGTLAALSQTTSQARVPSRSRYRESLWNQSYQDEWGHGGQYQP